MMDRLLTAALVCMGLVLPAAPVRGDTPADPVLLEDFVPEAKEQHLREAFAAHERRRTLLEDGPEATVSEEKASATLLASRALLRR
ncbi:MAG: hypothetical protein P1V51_10275 [Deltaproteobacteria bacterium]|nr:hypothetical protein [Deltaproteobacteria bacterium]